jgi:hypothetical protein
MILWVSESSVGIMVFVFAENDRIWGSLMGDFFCTFFPAGIKGGFLITGNCIYFYFLKKKKHKIFFHSTLKKKKNGGRKSSSFATFFTAKSVDPGFNHHNGELHIHGNGNLFHRNLSK